LILTKAPGNIFLLGEHSVVYGRPAIIASIGLNTKVLIEKRNDNTVVLDSKKYGFFQETTGGLSERVYETYQDYSDVLDPLRDFFDWLYPFQVKIHGGKASGSELISSILGGFNYIKVINNRNPIEIESRNLGNFSFNFVIADTGIEARTNGPVQLISKRREDSKEKFEKIFDNIKEIVMEGEKAVFTKNEKLLGELMNINHEILSRQLEVSNPLIDKLARIAKKEGAYGAKICGGGKGGVIIALTPREKVFRVAKALSLFGASVYLTDIGVKSIGRTN
jgi:mevalonate kinase